MKICVHFILADHCRKMKLSTLGYIIGTLVFCTVVYALMHNQSAFPAANDVYIQAVTTKSERNLNDRRVFQAERKSALKQQAFKPMVIPSERNASFDYKAAMQKLNDARVSHDDPRLIKLIRDYYIEPPSDAEYNLKDPDRLEYSNGQTPFVDSRLNYMVRSIFK